MLQFHENSLYTLGKIKYCSEHIIKDKPIGVIPVDYIWDPATDDQLWFRIPNFNGYEISDYLNIRSMKMFNKYPFGVLLKYTVTKDGQKIYELTDIDNMRIKISERDIINLAFYTNPSITSYGYPKKTYQAEKTSRNFRMWINQDPVLTAYKDGLQKVSVPLNKQEETAMARFTVTDDPEELDE